MKVLIKENGLVVATSSAAETVINGIFMNGVIFGEKELQLLDMSDTLDIVPQKHMIVNGEVLLNPDYIENEVMQLDSSIFKFKF